MKKWLKWTGILFLIPIALILVFASLLYIPSIQNYAVRKATRLASDATGMDIKLDRIRLTFPLSLTVDGVSVVNQPPDTLASLGRLSVRIDPLPLLGKVVSIDALRLKDVRVNTGGFIEGMLVRGSIDNLSLRANHISLKDEEALLNELLLSGAAITVRVDSASQKEEEASAPLRWKIKLGNVGLDNVCFALQMPADSLRLGTYVGNASLTDGLADLGIGRYATGALKLSGIDVAYDTNDNEPIPGLDTQHLALGNLEADLRSIDYRDKDIKADIKAFSATERSGLAITSLKGQLNSDSTTISIPGLQLKTPGSELSLIADIPWSMMETDKGEGHIDAFLEGSLGKEDILLFAQTLPEDFRAAWPDKPLRLSVKADGSLKALTITDLNVELPGAFSVKASGKAGELTDSIRRSADIRMAVQTLDMGFALAYLPVEQREQYRIPPLLLDGEFSLNNREYNTSLSLREAEAEVLLAARFHSLYETYRASLKIDNLKPAHFMPEDSIMLLNASLEAEGRGFDFFADSTRADIKAEIGNIQYDSLMLAGLSLNASLKDHQANAEIASKDSLALVNITLNGTVRKEDVQAIFIVDAEKINLHGLNLADSAFTTSFQLFAEGSSDLGLNNRLDVSLGNWEMRTPQQLIKPKLLTLLAKTTPDTARVSLHAGDLSAVLTGNASLDTMLNRVTAFTAVLGKHLRKDSILDIAALRPMLPDISLSITAGKDNPVYNFLRPYYIGFSQFSIEAETSPRRGIRMNAGIFSLYRDTFLIDTVRAYIRPDSAGLRYYAAVIKKQYRQQTPFTASISGAVRSRYADAGLLYRDRDGKTGLRLGVEARKDSAGFIFHLTPEEPVLAFNNFTLNPGNYFRFRSMKDMEGDIRFRGPEGSTVWLRSVKTGEAYPELQVELTQIDLGKVTTGFAQLPRMKGMFGANIRYAPTEESMLLVADAHVDTLYYENGRIGGMLLNAVYLPLGNDEHQIDAHLYRDEEEFVSATALYHAGAKEDIEGKLDITRLPLGMVSPFTGGMASLDGMLDGSMGISGSPEAPRLDGYIKLDTASAYITMADTRLRFDNKRVEVKDNLITFNKYNILASGNNPFVIDGNININNLSRITADLRLSAANMQVLDAKRTKESIVYGKLFANINSTVKGPLDALTVRGDFHVLGGTNATYVMTESALTVQDRLKDLVTFVSFADTLTRSRRQRGALPLGGIDMLTVIHIDPAVQLRVDITPDRSSYAEITGGGDLSFQYTRQGDMVLNGRYTFSEGNISYALPVIPLKEFHIHEGSYVQWDGEVMDPLLSINATERMRVSAKAASASSPQMVNFDVGLSIRNRLENMQMEFTIDAPENMAIQNELAAMGAEERSKQAVAMMITGTYLSSGGGMQNLSATDALNSFLNSEINNIAGDALKTVDISFGMDTYDEEGSSRRDFSFQFAKRFYNDRIRVMVGGKVSTGENVNNSAESFLDNVSVEYRLDPAGTKNVKVFHDITFDNLLEGEVRETGAGIVFRKKVRRLREMFDFRRKNKEQGTGSKEQGKTKDNGNDK